MGRANPALVIVVANWWWNRPEIEELRQLGHEIVRYPEHPGQHVDLILHPAAHGWHDELFGGPYLKAALTAARKRNRERKRK